MTFICESCCKAGAQPPRRSAAAKRQHAVCPGGTWCDCQHRTTGPKRENAS